MKFVCAMLLVLLLCLALRLGMHLEMWLWKQNIGCNLKVLHDSDNMLFNVICVIDPHVDKLSECTNFVVGHMHDDELVTKAGDSD